MKQAWLVMAMMWMGQSAQAAGLKYLWICQDARPIADAGYSVNVFRDGTALKVSLSVQSRRGPNVLGKWAVKQEGPKPGRPITIFQDRATGGVKLRVSIDPLGRGALKAHVKDQNIAASLKCQRGE